MQERSALDGSVDRASVKQDLVAASGSIVMECYFSLRTFLRKEFSVQYEILIIALQLACLSLTKGHFAVSAGENHQGCGKDNCQAQNRSRYRINSLHRV